LESESRLQGHAECETHLRIDIHTGEKLLEKSITLIAIDNKVKRLQLSIHPEIKLALGVLEVPLDAEPLHR